MHQSNLNQVERTSSQVYLNPMVMPFLTHSMFNLCSVMGVRPVFSHFMCNTCTWPLVTGGVEEKKG